MKAFKKKQEFFTEVLLFMLLIIVLKLTTQCVILENMEDLSMSHCVALHMRNIQLKPPFNCEM